MKGGLNFLLLVPQNKKGGGGATIIVQFAADLMHVSAPAVIAIFPIIVKSNN